MKICETTQTCIFDVLVDMDDEKVLLRSLSQQPSQGPRAPFFGTQNCSTSGPTQSYELIQWTYDL